MQWADDWDLLLSAWAVLLCVLAAGLLPSCLDRHEGDKPIRIGTHKGLPVYVRLVDGHQVEVTFSRKPMACDPPRESCTYVPAMIELELRNFDGEGRFKP